MHKVFYPVQISTNYQPMANFINIAAYKFVKLDRLADRKAHLLPFCKSRGLKGTILLSKEGINLFLAGEREPIEQFLAELRSQPEFCDLTVKESVSDHQPFSRMLVRLKKEIISMGVDSIQPAETTSPKISAHQLKEWLDEGRDITLLDTRNDYEVEIGTFENATPIGIDHFRRFPAAVSKLPQSMREKPVVMFCTGGIRCEKAGPLMEQNGFDQVFQLDGGILKYFEECGGEHYQGDCFVFDKRVAVDPDLKETEFGQCYACQAILSVDAQRSEKYDPPHCCPHCYLTPLEKMQAVLAERRIQLTEMTRTLPGSIPYDNVRPMNVPLKFNQQPVLDFLSDLHAKLDREFWANECKSGRVTYKGRPLSADDLIQASWRIQHHVPQTTEPDVSNDVGFLYEDEAIIAVDKPAPLPMHACGRFNRNTLLYFLGLVFHGEQIRILHRLDAATTGVVLFARKKSAATFIHEQFRNGVVKKTYLARVHGVPQQDSFSCDAAISNGPEGKLGTRTIQSDGLPSLTEFEVIERFDDDTTLLKCFPKTGRTNQLRIHLQQLGFPIVGDSNYGIEEKDNVDMANDRLCLHAHSISFRNPINGETQTITSQSTPDWRKTSAGV